MKKFFKRMYRFCLNLLRSCNRNRKRNNYKTNIQNLYGLKNLNVEDTTSNNLRLCYPKENPFRSQVNFLINPTFLFTLNVLSWLGFTTEDENKESELIMTLKRAVLCTNREEYDKAEQLLHIALRLAQQQQNKQGELYCYDLMANLAFDRLEFGKSEKLFVTVMQLLLSQGVEQDDLKLIHISLKLARIAQLNADIERAKLGYEWCLEQIKKHKNDSFDAKMLNGVIQDWYAQFLLDIGEVNESLIHLKQAYDICKNTKGKHTEQSMLILNDLGTTSFRAGDLNNAKTYLEEAVDVGSQIEDKKHLGVIKANLGLILLEKGFASEAEIYCTEGWRLGKKYDNSESVEQANYCIEQIKLNFESRAYDNFILGSRAKQK